MHGASGAAAAVKNPHASKSSFWGELPQHVMSGISRMVPTLIMGGVILAFSQLIAYSWLKIPADIGIMDALNSGKFSGFDLSLVQPLCMAHPVRQRQLRIRMPLNPASGVNSRSM